MAVVSILLDKTNAFGFDDGVHAIVVGTITYYCLPRMEFLRLANPPTPVVSNPGASSAQEAFRVPKPVRDLA